MNVERVYASDVPFQPWRNGGGVMQELLLRPPGPDWKVRVGLAEIGADGPFSAYPGVERYLAVLRGAGLVLTIDGVAHRCTRETAPLVFDGGAPTGCALIDGPCQVLNLLTHGVAGAMRRVDGGEPWLPASGWCGLYAVVAGRFETRSKRDESIDVLPRTLLSFDSAPRSLAFRRGDAQRGAAGYWLSAASR